MGPKLKELLPVLLALSAQAAAQRDDSEMEILLRTGTEHYHHGQLGNAEADLLKSLDIARRLGSPEHIAAATGRLGLVHLYQSKLPDAQRYLEESEELWRSLGPAAEPRRIAVLTSLVLLHTKAGRFAEARISFDTALDWCNKPENLTRPESAAILTDLAKLPAATGQWEAAERLYRRAISLSETVPAGHRHFVLTAYVELADVLLSARRKTEAEQVLIRASEIAHRELGPDHPFTAVCGSKLSVALAANGKLDRAKVLAFHSLAVLERQVDVDNLVLANALDAAAGISLSLREYASALELFQRGIGIVSVHLPPDHPDLLAAKTMVATLLRKTNRKGEAKQVEAEIKAIRESAFRSPPRLVPQ